MPDGGKYARAQAALPIVEAGNVWLRRGAGTAAGTPRPRQPTRLPPRRHRRPALAHGVAHRLSGGWRAGPLPPRLSPHRRAQPDPRQRPRAGRHAPDRAQEPDHLRPLQHYPRAGTARRRGPTRRLSGAAGAGGTSPSAVPRGRSRHPAHRITPPPRATRHRVKGSGGRRGPDTARLFAAARAQANRYEPASDRGTRGNRAGRRGRTQARARHRQRHRAQQRGDMRSQALSTPVAGVRGPDVDPVLGRKGVEGQAHATRR